MKDDTPKPAAKPANRKSLSDAAQATAQAILRYGTVLFMVLLIAVYGFVVYRIYLAGSAEPSVAEISTHAQETATPHIDAKAVGQLETLQDRSVNVKTLFDQARNNPFGE